MKLAAALIPILALPASALGPLLNGNFENQSGSGEMQTVDGWFEFSAAGYDDWVNVAPNNAAQFPPGQGNIFNMSTDSGFIYQTIGTRGDADLGLRVGGKAIFRYPFGPREFRGFRISIYQTDAGTSGADGTHPATMPGSELLDSKVFTKSDLGFSVPHVSPEARPFSVDLSLGNATTGGRLWLAIDAMAGLNEAGLDDLAITPLATDPGPATGPSLPRVMLVGDSFWQGDEMRQTRTGQLSPLVAGRGGCPDPQWLVLDALPQRQEHRRLAGHLPRLGGP